MTQPIPKGYDRLIPYLTIKDAAKAVEFYKQAFGATEMDCMMKSPDTGMLMHGELKINGQVVMLSDECADFKMFSPLHYKGTSMSLHLYVEDCDKTFEAAKKAGAKEVQPMQDQFWGDRMGRLRDPFGHEWTIATHKEDLTPEEVAKRGEEFMKKMKKETAAA